MSKFILFITLQVALLILSVVIVAFAVKDYQVFLSSPIALQILMVLGLLTPLYNIHSKLKLIILLGEIVKEKE